MHFWKIIMNPFIPYARQSINADDIADVNNILVSDWLTQGPTIDAFEQAVAAYCNVSYGVAVSSGTAALHLAALSLGLGPGDYLWTSPNTFVASANCALYCGAEVDFVDIELSTYNLCITALTEKLAKAEKAGKLPKVVVPVHFAGQSCDMKAIKKLSERYGFKIIEDASHALGGTYEDHKIGACIYSDITIFSFHPVKMITTGEGGLLLTNDPALRDKLMRLRTHGITRDVTQMTEETQDPWYYQQIELGFNYRITDMQAGLGLSQLKRLEQYLTKRQLLAQRYHDELNGLPLVLPWQHPNNQSAWHLYVILIDPYDRQISRLDLFNHMRQAQIGVNVHYIPVHLQPFYQHRGFKGKHFPNAEFYYQHALTIPLFPSMTDMDQDRVITILKNYLQ
mgnify:CR=1 FL=1